MEISKFVSLAEEFESLQKQLSLPEVFENPTEFVKVSKRIAEIRPIVELFYEIQKYEKQKAESLEMMRDPEMKELASEEFSESTKCLEELYEKLKIALIPRDPHDNANTLIEVRQAAGGDEAALFAAELARAYMKYAEQMGFTVEILSWQDSSESGGLKEGVIEISGLGAYSRFKYESGVHRVQRVPATENQGRIHTSTCTVAVMPEAAEVDIEIRQEDLRIDTYRASGAGGQHVNKTESAIRITHMPTGVVVTCQDQRSQHKNKDKAMSILRSRLYQAEQEKQEKASSAMRLSQVGSGDRSEKIRTYNFPQDRITDHRIKESWSNLPSIMEGNLQDMIDKIIMEDNARKLALLGEDK